MDAQLAKERIKLSFERMCDIEAKAEREGREINKEELSIIAQLEGAIKSMEKELPEKPLTVQNFGGGHSGRVMSGDTGGFASPGEQFMAIKNAGIPGGQVDPRLHQIQAVASGLNESVPSEGGFLLAPTFSSQILQVAFDTGKLAKLCGYQPIGSNSNSMKINGLDETSREAGSRHGGVRSYWIDEAGEKEASKPKFRQIGLNLHKNVVLIYATDELLDDAVALEGFIRKVAPAEIAFNVDDGIINGTGAGQPLGILNAGCLVQVAKETGQKADTLVAENVIKMIARTLGNSGNYVWLHSKTSLPQIYQMSLAVGTGGIPLFMAGGSLPNQPENRLLGLPLIECEQCPVLGDLGDLILADLGNGYIIADKGGIKSDVSIHCRFVWDESVFRFVYRVDACPVLSSAITPYKGGAENAQSHFISIAERA